MRAVYRKEIRSAKASMLGYIFIAFLLAAIGLYFSFTNLNLASPKFEAVLGSVQFVFLVFVPILTMRTLAEEKKQRTDQLLFTVPLTPLEIVMGKYLALLTLFAVPMAVICSYPLILSRYGAVNFRAAYGSVLGFFLLGCAYLSIGLFCSSLTSSPAVSAVLTFLVLLATYVMDTAARMVPASLSGTLGSFLSLFYLNGRLGGFTEGILDLRAVIYFLGICCFMVYLTALSVSRHDRRDSSKASDRIYCLVSAALVLACVVVTGRIGERLPSSVMEPDFTTSKIYTLTEETRSFLGRLTQDVRLIYVCERGKEDDIIERFLEKYAQENPHIQYEKTDPAVNPAYLSGITDEKISGSSVIIVCGDRSRVISCDGFFTVGTSSVTGRRTLTGFLGESLISQAVDSLLQDRKRIFYLPDANGEQELGESFLETARYHQIEVKSLNLLTSDEVPEDADGLILNAPSTDYSAETADKILRYLEAGGKALILSNYSLTPMPEFDRILADYGMERKDGIILEGDSGRFISYQYCLIPSVSYTDITAEVYREGYLLLPMAQGIGERDTYRSSVRLTPLLSTSTESYNKADVQNMTTSEKEPGDEAGPFLIGMLAQEDIDQNGDEDTEIIYFTTGYFLDEDYNRSVSGTNAVLFGSSLRYLAGEESSGLQIPARSLTDPVLAMTDFAANFWTVVCVFVLPGLWLLVGVVRWQVRKRKSAVRPAADEEGGPL